MPKACAIAGVVVAALVVATLAYGQGHGKGPRPAGKPKPAPSSSADNPYEDKGPPSASPPPQSTTVSAQAASPPLSAADAGLPPPAPSLESSDGGASSPLNPAPNEFSEAGPQVPSVDYDRLLADIASLRARVAAVSDTLFHSRVAIAVQTNGDHGRIQSMSVSLDDGLVWTSPASFRAEEPTTVYEHSVAPGHHTVTLDVERRDDRNDVFRTSQRSRFAIEVPAEQRLAFEIKISDDSSMGADFPSDKKGEYELRVRARAEARGPNK
jgi:hypothetical protein